MLELLVAIVGAAGTVLTAYVVHVVAATRRAVNGNVAALEARVALLEELLSFARAGGFQAQPLDYADDPPTSKPQEPF